MNFTILSCCPYAHGLALKLPWKGESVKKLLLLLPALALMGIYTADRHDASAVYLHELDQNVIVEHGGGCRKSSPAGQCCHAGLQPYHCH